MIWQKYREPWQKMSDSTGMPMLHTWMPNLHAGHSCAGKTVRVGFRFAGGHGQSQHGDEGSDADQFEVVRLRVAGKVRTRIRPS